MIGMEETDTQTRRLRYTMAAPDTSNIIGDVEGDMVTISYAGSSLSIPVDTLPAVTALAATMTAGVRPITPPQPEPEPEIDDASGDDVALPEQTPVPS